MTHSPVVLVLIYTRKHVHSPLPQDIRTQEVFAAPAKPPATSQLFISTSTPWKPNRRASQGRTYVDMCILIPYLLMVLSAIQSPWRPTRTTRRVWNPKFFIIPGVDWCVTNVNSSLTHRRVRKALLPFFCPTKSQMSASTKACMASINARNAPFPSPN